MKKLIVLCLLFAAPAMAGMYSADWYDGWLRGYIEGDIDGAKNWIRMARRESYSACIRELDKHHDLFIIYDRDGQIIETVVDACIRITGFGQPVEL